MGEHVKTLTAKIEVLEKAVPAGPKALTKALGDDRFAEGKEKSTRMSKSQVASKLTDLMIKGESGVSAHDITKFESTGQLRPDLMAVLFPAAPAA
jgi:hypothetical protein